jgi:hypothetical protein
LRDSFVAISGRVMHEHGSVAATGITVAAWSGLERVAVTRTSSEGVYTFSRRWLDPGRRYRVIAEASGFERSPSRTVEVHAGRTVTNVDFSL